MCRIVFRIVDWGLEPHISSHRPFEPDSTSHTAQASLPLQVKPKPIQPTRCRIPVIVWVWPKIIICSNGPSSKSNDFGQSAYVVFLRRMPSCQFYHHNHSQINDGRGDGNGKGSNVWVILEHSGHVPQQCWKAVCKFYCNWNVPYININIRFHQQLNIIEAYSFILTPPLLHQSQQSIDPLCDPSLPCHIWRLPFHQFPPCTFLKSHLISPNIESL